MKTVLLIRHAKSSWDDSSVSDFDRPLNERGKKNAPEMAVRLHDKGIRPDMLVSSPAKRAKQTAKAFQKILEVRDLEFIDELYLPSTEAFAKVISNLPAKVNSVAIFSHNPGITEFANLLTTTRIDNMPTTSVFAVKAEVKDWADFTAQHTRFWFFDYPKAIH
jgi:phosphohistidine phosphatase